MKSNKGFQAKKQSAHTYIHQNSLIFSGVTINDRKSVLTQALWCSILFAREIFDAHQVDEILTAYQVPMHKGANSNQNDTTKMKNILARTIALLFILAFGVNANASVIITMNVQLNAGISWSDAYLNVYPSQITTTTNPGIACIGFNIAGDANTPSYDLLGIELSTFVNGSKTSTTSYNEFTNSGILNLIGVFPGNAYMGGPFGQGLITDCVGANRTTLGAYDLTGLQPGGEWEIQLTTHIAGQPDAWSKASVQYIPEPKSYTLFATFITMALMRRHRLR